MYNRAFLAVPRPVFLSNSISLPFTSQTLVRGGQVE